MRYLVLITFLIGYLNSFSQIIISSQPIEPSCMGMCDGQIIVNPSGGTPFTSGSPYLYSWNSVPAQNTQIAMNLCSGTYIVTVTDSLGLTANDTIVLLDPPPFMVSINTTDDTCGLCVGSVNVIASGGPSPYAYTWSNGTTTALQTGLCAGTYSVVVTNANGCSSGLAATINLAPGSSCGYGVINGTLYKDDNANCSQDTLEIGLANVMIEATPGPYYATTDSNGDYSLVAPFGNYTVSQVAQPFYNEICPVAGSYSVILDSINSAINNNDFGDTITSAQEISVQLTTGIPRPWFPFDYYISYTSLNSSSMNGTVYLVFDDTLMFQNASVTPDAISGDTLFWNYTNLQQFENRNISATFVVPGQVGLLGDSLQACASITPLIGDAIPSNNTSCVSDEIVGAYDPNDKQVSPAGVGPTGDIYLTDNELKYTIRFQNTGTFLAEDVVVVDTLSENLDVSSLRGIIASHPFKYNVNGQGVLTFTFNNIMLPDSNTNEPGSHGLIEFVIDQHPSNTIGTVIENTAEIYFDFNPAIVTNTVVNTIINVTDVSERLNSLNTVNVYPNPSNGVFTINLELEKSEEVTIRVVDMLGKTVQELSHQKMHKGDNKTEMNISEMDSGIYFMSIQIGGENHLKKIVVR